MFCPQCGHQQVSNDTRFCSRCGLSLSLAADSLINSGNLQREKRELTGIGLLIATVALLLNFVIVYGLATLPHLVSPVFLWIWICFVAISFVVGGFGLANLIRGGFFKRLKDRESRLRLMTAEPEHSMLTQDTSVRIDAGTKPRLVEPVSVTETTTRELKTIPKANG